MPKTNTLLTMPNYEVLTIHEPPWAARTAFIIQGHNVLAMSPAKGMARLPKPAKVPLHMPTHPYDDPVTGDVRPSLRLSRRLAWITQLTLASRADVAKTLGLLLDRIEQHRGRRTTMSRGILETLEVTINAVTPTIALRASPRIVRKQVVLIMDKANIEALIRLVRNINTVVPTPPTRRARVSAAAAERRVRGVAKKGARRRRVIREYEELDPPASVKVTLPAHDSQHADVIDVSDTMGDDVE